MDKIQIIDPCKDERWDRFVQNHPCGWIVHLSGWKSAIEDSFPHIKGHFLALIDADTEEIEAGFPVYEIKSCLTGKRLVSIPFATASQLLVKTRHEIVSLLMEAKKLFRRSDSKYLEIRTLGPVSLDFCDQLASYSNYKFHYLDLTDGIENIWKNTSYKSVRYEINKSMKKGIQFQIGKTEKDLQTFYRLYAVTRRRLGLPAQPYLFFEKLYALYSQKGIVAVHLATIEERAIAAQLLFKFNGRVSVEAAGDHPDFRDIGSSRFLYWEGIKLASSEGYRMFDFGRTSVLNGSLLASKRRWRAKEMDLYNHFYHRNRLNSKKTVDEDSTLYKFMRVVCKNSPKQFHPVISNFCYRHLG